MGKHHDNTGSCRQHLLEHGFRPRGHIGRDCGCEYDDSRAGLGHVLAAEVGVPEGGAMKVGGRGVGLGGLMGGVS